MFLIMVQYAWGRGATLEEAKAEVLKAAGMRRRKTLPAPRIVYQYDAPATEYAGISDDGCLTWKGERPKEIERVPRRK